MIDTVCDSPTNDTYTQNDCPDYNGRKVALVIYTTYLMFLLILAINLLIAIFKYFKQERKNGEILLSKQSNFFFDFSVT